MGLNCAGMHAHDYFWSQRTDEITRFQLTDRNRWYATEDFSIILTAVIPILDGVWLVNQNIQAVVWNWRVVCDRFQRLINRISVRRTLPWKVVVFNAYLWALLVSCTLPSPYAQRKTAYTLKYTSYFVTRKLYTSFLPQVLTDLDLKINANYNLFSFVFWLQWCLLRASPLFGWPSIVLVDKRGGIILIFPRIWNVLIRPI